MENCITHFSAVQPVVVDVFHPFTAEDLHHNHGDIGTDHLAGFDIVIQPFDLLLSTRTLVLVAKRSRGLKFDTGRMPGTISTSMPAVAKAQVALNVERRTE